MTQQEVGVILRQVMSLVLKNETKQKYLAAWRMSLVQFAIRTFQVI